jgi:hypothetical protein
MRRVVGASVLLATVISCSALSSAPVTPTSAPCDAPAQKIADPTGVTAPGYRLGPVMLAGFSVEGSPSSPRPIGAPTKVLIHPVEKIDQPITLAGTRCSDGQPLRFWYRGGTPFTLGPGSTPVPEAVLATTGDSSVEVKSGGGGAGADYTGYMLFPTTGTYRVRAQSAGHDLDEVIVSVP